MTWNYYGAMKIAVSSVIIIGGGIGVMKYRAYRGERVVEWAAAVAERRDVPGGAGPAWETNDVEVTPYMRWSTISDNILEPVRDMVTGKTYPFWLAGEMSGSVVTVAQAETSWYATASGDTTNWYCTAFSNLQENVQTTASILPGDMYVAMPGVDTQKLPFAEAAYPGSSINLATNTTIFEGENNWWSYAGYGTNVYKYASEWVTNGVLHSSKFILETNFVQTARIMHSLTQTAYLAPMTYVKSCTNSPAGTGVNATTNFPTITSGSYSAGDIVGYANDEYFKSTAYGEGWETLFEVSVWGEIWFERSTSIFGDEYYYGAKASISGFAPSRPSCHFEYPSLYALTNGYVDSVKIYLVCEVARATRIGVDPFIQAYVAQPGPVLEGGDYEQDITDLQIDYTLPSYYTDYLFGSIAAVCGFPPDPPLISAWTQASPGEQVGAAKTINRVAVLVGEVDCTSATEYPVFAVGADTVSSLGLASSDLQKHSWTVEGDGLTAGTNTQAYSDSARHEYYKFDVEITALYGVIVAEWTWKHLNEDTPYEPPAEELNTPDWVTDNVAPF